MKKILCVLLVVLMCLTAAPLGCFADLDLGVTASALNATGKCGKTATYTFDSATGKLTIEGTGKINAEAFYSNEDIKEVVIGDGITEIGADAFNGSSITSVDFGNGVTIIGNRAFHTCIALTSVVIPDNVITIGEQVFEFCSGLESINIGDGVTSIGINAFFNCYNLANVDIGSRVEFIGGGAFSNCNNLINVIIPDGVTNIGAGAFAYCYELVSVFIGNNVKNIHYNSFYDCPNLKSINIPKTVTYIGSEAFRYCSSLYDVYYAGSEAEWNAIDIRANNTALENAEIHFAETHTHTWDVEEITKEPTCTVQGEKTIRCKNAICQKTEEIPALGHNFADYYSDGNATCYKDGTKTAECNRCWGEKDTIVDEGSKDKVAHKFDNGKCTVCGAGCEHENLAWYDGYDATCTSVGFKEHYECKDCYQYLDSNKYVVDKYDLIIAKGEHKFTKYNVVKDATCTANAIEKATCDICEEATHERPIPGTMIAHTFKDYKSDGNATCKADGTMTAVCEMCKEAKDTKTDVDSHKTAPHTPDAAGGRCTLCGEMLVCLHTYSADKLITKTPTCTDEGQKAIVCSKCNANKPGSEEVIPELGHDFEITTKASDATCTEDGKTFSGKCKRCSFIEVGKTIPALGHLFTTEKVIIKAPTCIAEGKKAIRCERCHAIEPGTEEVIPATHNYPDKWSVVIAPDCQNTGVAVKVCFSCHDVIAQKVPKAGHADLDGDSKCDTCEMIIVAEPEEPTEPDTPNEPEEKPCDCDCHAGGIKAFFFKLINFFAKIFDKSARVCKCGASH